jgi:phage terminase large subunit
MASVHVDLEALPDVMNPAFIDLLDNKSRRLIMKGGAGSGKSTVAAQKCIVRMLEEPGHRCVGFRKVARTLRESCFAEIKNMIREWGLSELFKVSESALKVSCINGSEMIFSGLDDVEKLKSIYRINSCWIEEATELTEEDYMQINLRIRGRSSYYKQIILTFNPIDINHWIKKRFFDTKQPNTFIHNSTFRDNNFLDSEYKKEIRRLKKTNKRLYAIYGRGEWGYLEGLIYGAFPFASFPEFDYDYDVFGIDFGFNNPNVIVQGRVKGDAIYLKEVLYRSGLTTPQLITTMAELGLPKHCLYYPDPANADAIRQLEQAGYPCKLASKDVIIGIGFVKSMRIYSNETNINLNNEASSYVWEVDKNGERIDAPVKWNDHAMDALRYMIYGHFKEYSGQSTLRRYKLGKGF